MAKQAVGIRSLAVSFPSVIRTQESWCEAFPELAARARARVRLPRASRTSGDRDSEIRTSQHSDLDIWSQEVAPYLADPFRGNVERRKLASEESPRSLECLAAREALAAARIAPEEVDLAIAGSIFSEPVGAGNAPYLARELGLHCPAWNLDSTCSSALVALQNACALVRSGEYRNVLAIVSHFGSRAADETDTLSWSMGDGAGAFVVGDLSPDRGILGTYVISTIDTCGAYVREIVADTQGASRMRTRTGENASAIAETAVRYVRACCQGAAAKAGVDLDRIDFFAFNTPTAWYASVCARALDIDPERTMNLYPRYANVGPVLAIANLYHAAESGRLRDGDLVLVYTQGAGATAVATIMRWGEVALGVKPEPPANVTPEQEKVRLAVATLSSTTTSTTTAMAVGQQEPTDVTAEFLSREMLQAAETEKRRQMLEAYLLAWLARSLPSLPSPLAPEQPFATLLDSLMALTFKSRIETDLQVRVSMEQFFGERTIAQLAECILAQLELPVCATELPSLVPEPERRYEPFPLTDMQYAFWVGRSGVLELGTVANHGYYEIEGRDLDLERLNEALRTAIDRHDMLRAIVLPDGRQRVLETVPPYQMPITDLRGKSEDAVRAALEEIRDRLSHQVVPADRWPLFEFGATQLDGGRVRLHISYDLQVFDAWSLFRLFDEWAQLYENPDAPLPPLDISFRDYVLAERALQETEAYRRSQAYWLDRLDSLPPAPDLPLATNPKNLKQHRTRRYEARCDRDKWQQLKQRAADAGLTPSGLLLAAFAEVIAGWSREPCFTLNLALFNRLPFHPQVNNLLGDFTSVTLLAVDLSAPAPFAERAARVQKQMWQDLEHRYYSGVNVVRELARKRGAAPSAMPIVFTSTLGFRSLGQDTLTFSRFGDRVYGISQASQAWMDVQVWEENEELTYNWDVVEGLFPEGAIAAMFEAYGRLLERLATSEVSWSETSRSLLPPGQQQQRDAANATEAPISDDLLHERFVELACLQPDAPAVVTSQRTLTYGELYDLARCLGRRLRQMGVVANQLVAIALEKGWEQIVAVLGVLMSGAAYVPLDPDLPPERLTYLLENSEAKIVVTQSQLVASRSWLDGLQDGIQYLCVDVAIADESASEADWEPLPSVQTADDLAYVIYTSGSTGNPKGVAIAHRGAVNVMTHTNQRFDVGPQDRALALTALNHDLSVYDIFGLLSAGGAIVMPDADAVKDPSHWAELANRERITLWNSVPAFMEMLVDYAEEAGAALPDSLRLVILGGDWLPVSLPDRLRNFVPKTQILSIGGPTETTIWNIGYLIGEVDPNWASIPYGKPMANAKYYILNEALEDCPDWVAGQMYCAGVQLARGYWGDEEKTRQKFIVHPRTGDRIYATGDRGRYRPDGTIEFLGRVDFQVKLRGNRIEVGEVEAILTRYPTVRSAAVVAVGDPHPDRLVAYIVPQAESAPDLEELRDFLKQKLPIHMMPSGFAVVDALPLSANGKVDRKALLARSDRVQALEVAYVAPQNQLEKAIAAVFQEVLEVPEVGVNNNFFELGGNSLLLAKVYRSLRQALPDRTQSISLVDLFNYSSVKSLAQYLNQDKSQSSLEKQMQAKEQNLARGKDRMKYRREKSKRA